jgi:hypothetical protein
VFVRQCLGRRIATAEELKKVIAAWEKQRYEAPATIERSFRIADLRKKLHGIDPS